MPGHRPQMSTNEKFDGKSIKKLIVFCKEFLPSAALALLCGVVGTIPSIIGPSKISELMNIITAGVNNPSGVNMNEFIVIAKFLIILYLGGALISYGQQWIMAETTQNIARKLRTNLNNKLNKLPLKYFDSSSTGDILSRFSNDIDTISTAFSNSFASIVTAMLLFFGILIIMFSINILLAIVCIVCSLLGFVLMFVSSNKSQKFFSKRQKNLGELNGHIEEVFTNHHVVESFNGEDEATTIFDNKNNELYDNSIKANLIMGLSRPLMGFSGNLAYAAIFIVGVSLIISGKAGITYGTIISFTIYARLFSTPLNTFAQSMTSILQASAASRRVFEVLEEKELDDESNKQVIISDVKGNVEFNSVHFGYDENKEIIHGFSGKFKAGQKVAIVGPTGAGKTTIVNLLMRFYEVNEGSITIDGISSKDMKRENVRDLFDMILQDTWLFKGTIRENLIFNEQNISDEQLDKVTKAVGLRHFIKSLPMGYDTMLDETLALSEGQKQQLTIARAMIKDSPLLILDEATSSVDTRTEIIIQKAMDELTKNRTSFVIAHRLSTIKNADIILVLNNGDVVESGTHEQLLSKGGFYSELYNSQFEVIE